MTHLINKNTLLIKETEPAKCSECGMKAELRPYGKNGAFVCFQCGMKDEEEMKKQFNKLFNDKRDI